jgi:hypothetical protein
MATSVAWILGRFLLPNLAFWIIGLALGILQWLILQQRVPHAWQWILATTLGWVVGAIPVVFIFPQGFDFLAGVATGLTVGGAQWLVLRRQVHWSGWWIMMNVVAWTTGYALLPGVLLTGIVVAVITATAIALLFRYPTR